ncbi:MAG: UDP-3-O-(3-hydroxymyristoyl)glucosamine N-acyltransferase [Bacteroidaceae bacterium]|nr:UDP-3-O-(3-hydroxymyristoyl)glucosamine N-acyltransferase [Bacteroidaceae bacterium]
MTFTAQQIADLTGGQIEGNPQATISTFAKIEEGVAGAISFLANSKYEHYIYTTQSSVVLVNKDFQPTEKVSATLIRVEDAYESVAKLLGIYQSMQPSRTGIDPKASVSEKATIGANCYIGPYAVVDDGAVVGDNTQVLPHAYIGERAKVGNGCIINANVSIYHDCVVGNNCILHSGCVIGADGFGFAPTEHGYEKIAQIGIVTIEDDVEIGANTCVDRSTMGSTYVRRGVKLDNLVQIAHNCEVGSHTVMSAQVGVAGSTKIGEWCMFGGQVGIAGHIKVGDRTLCGAQAGIAGPVAGNCKIMGSPAIDWGNFTRSSVVFKSLPEIRKTLNALCKDVEKLKSDSKDKE